MWEQETCVAAGDSPARFSGETLAAPHLAVILGSGIARNASDSRRRALSNSQRAWPSPDRQFFACNLCLRKIF